MSIMKSTRLMPASGPSRARLVRNLMLTASVVVGFAGAANAQTADAAAAPAQAPVQTDQAQTSTTPTDAQPGTDIVVTGYRQSIEASLAQKRNANAFVDVITADDVGKFPDKNVADALQRVPGVIIERDGGEGSTVSIRGLSSDLTLTELNGNFLASATQGDPSRSFDYLLLPANMIASVDVYKSPEARLDEGGVGGVIINHTRKPFDLKPWFATAQIEGTYADVTKKVEPDASGVISWHNSDKTLGFLVGATYQERTNRSLGANTESWHWWSDSQTGQPATDIHGNTYADDSAISYWGSGETTQDGTHYSGYWAPQSVDETVNVEKRKRLGIQATAQMRPFDNLEITANYFRFQLSQNNVNNVLKIPEWGYGDGGKLFESAKFDPSGTIMQSATFQVPAEGTGCRLVTVDPVTGTESDPCTMETPAMQSYYARQKIVSNTYDVHGDWNVGRLDVAFTLGKTKATGGPSFEFFSQAKPRVVTGHGAAGNVNGNHLSQWTFTDQSVAMQFSPDLQQNIMNGLTQIDLGSTGSGYTNSSIGQRYAQVDITRHFGSFIDSIQIGGKWRDSFIERKTGEFDWYADAGNTLRYQDAPGAAVTSPDFFLSQPIGNIAGGFSTSAFPAFNMPNYLKYLNSTYNGPVRVPQPQNLYNIDERIWAGYAQLNYKTDTIRGNIGVRFVNTKETGVSTDVIYYEDKYCKHEVADDPHSPPQVGADGNCLVYPQAERERRVYSPHEESKEYSNILPSFNIAWNITRNLLARGEVVEGLQSGLNVYDDPYEQVDLNASYNIFKNLQLTASVINLTKSEQRQHLGNDTKDRFVSDVYSGRRYYLGLSYNF
jgi:TonB-dependent receptor